MNTSSEFIGFVRGDEVHGLSEYDPLGKTVTPSSNGKTVTRWHLIEAIENMHDADVDFICKLARRNSDTTLGQAMCWETLMEMVKKYLAEVEERLEGDADFEYRDPFRR